MHLARHAYGNISRDKIPLKQLYRHSSIKTTINYQKAFFNIGTENALDAILLLVTDSFKY